MVGRSADVRAQAQDARDAL